MRKLITLFLVLCSTMALAQSYNNEWIDFSKTYYKFKVGATGLYRIGQSALPAAIATAPAENFQLWRNGKQVPLYTSAATGVLPGTGFIEFWGERNDGVADKVMYRDPSYQLSDRISLQTDTAAFFLTVNPSPTTANPNLRFATTTNDVSGTNTPEPYFMYAQRFDFREQINRGKGVNAGTRVTSSSYDVGEGFTTNDIHYTKPSNTGYSFSSNVFYPLTTGPSATLTMGVSGVSYDDGGRDVFLKMNGDRWINEFLYDAVNLGQAAKIYAATVPANKVLTTNNFNVTIDFLTNPNYADSFNNRIAVSFIELKYARLFNFTGLSNFRFTLAANTQGNYIEVPTANFTGSLPVLYDVTNLKRYAAVISGNVIKFKLQGSAVDRDLILTNADPSTNINAVTAFTQRNFTNYATTANQGTYLIVSHSSLGFQSGGAVAAFRDYRASANGGGFNAKIYDIDELVDQFAFGIKKHPLSIKNFVRYAKANFSSANNPSHILLIGKGMTYEDYRNHESGAYIEQLNLVPTWGWPASDVLMVSPGIDPLPSLMLGRLSVVNQQEINLYLDKVKAYEVQRASTSQTIADKLWMKQVVHVAGSNDPSIEPLLIYYLGGYKDIIQKPLFGGHVADFNTVVTGGSATPAVTDYLKSLFKSGIGLLTYFGHSAATKLDYDMEDPYAYDNQDKYPMFLLNGCNAGNFFDYDVTRLNLLSSFSEKFVLAQNRGAIGVIASSHFGLTNYLDTYSTGFYNSLISPAGYNTYVGKNMLDAIQELNPSAFGDLLRRMHAEQFMLHGDPALKVYASTKPDFVVEPQTVSINPSVITVADNKFTLKAVFYNLGRALPVVTDSVSVLIKWQHGNGLVDTIANQKFRIVYADSLIKDLAIVPTRDGGNNRITVMVDSRFEYDELSESNNSVDKDFVIFTDNARPVYPYNFSIINKPTSKLFASTANPLPLTVAKNYEMQMDTTELFNSSFKITKTVNSFGGLLEFDPAITYKDSTVYYWRVAAVPTSGPYIWNTSSFVYLNGTETGFNQSHLYQHFKSTFERIKLDSFSRVWNYDKILSNITVTQAVYPFTNEDSHFSIAVNGLIGPSSGCLGSSVRFSVYDPVTLKPWYNQTPQPYTYQAGTPGGFMQSAGACKPGTEWNFEYSYKTLAGRQLMANFMDAVPNGYIVIARLNIDADQPNPDPLNPTYNTVPYAATWATDPAATSVYNRLKAAGFADIDSFNRARVWAFIYKKNNPDFAPKWAFSASAYNVSDVANLNAVVQSSDTLGYITSPAFGPAAAWKQLKWRGSSLEAIAGDIPTVDVIGVNNAGVETVLYPGLNLTQQDFNIAAINATTYPYIKLKMRNFDKANLTPYQLRYWRLIGDMVPEGALAANIKYVFKDTVEVGEKLNFSVAFKNIGDVAFSKDSVSVKLQVIDRNNVTNTIAVPRIKKPAVGDTTSFNVSIDTKNYSGLNTMFADINPDNDQPEQYHFNNFLYKNFYVNADKTNPLVDVTFDGVHILNGDIVSAKPAIHIKLKDESRYLALTDTAGVAVQLRYPDNSIRKFKYGTDTLRFTPANLSNGDNTAGVDFTPTLLDDGEYELTVKGKDISQNNAGTQDYRVTFNIYNQPAITEVFNYPNPFTTSTAFVFTLTGSQLPSNIRIQILTVTGKIVREINKDELGPIRIGRNITEFKWDGTDQYGAKLGNGVYLYRVITNLNGNSLDKFNIRDKDGGKLDLGKYFKGGYGKMYLMR